MRVAIIGGTGVLGAHVVPRLLERGHDVQVLGTRPDSVRRLERLGARGFTGSIFEPATLLPALAGCDAALHLATSVPRPGAKPDFTMNDRIRREGIQCLLSVCAKAQITRLVVQSIAMLHADPDRGWADENSPIHPHLVTASAADMEKMVRDSALDWRIVRGGLFYGPRTGSDEEWRELVRKNQLVAPGDGGDYVSLVHVSDMAEATVLATLAQTGKFIVNAVDDYPVTYAELYGHIAKLEGREAPASGAALRIPSFRVRNDEAKSRLGWRPHYPSYRSGIA